MMFSAPFHDVLPGKNHAWLCFIAVALTVWPRASDAPGEKGQPALVVELGRRLVAPGNPDAFVEDEQIAGVLALGPGTLVVTPHRAGRTRLGWRSPAPAWRELIVTSALDWPGPPPPAEPAQEATDSPKRPIDPPRHTLGGVLGTSDHRVALIDGNPVGVGDTVGDMIVDTIEDSRVVLRRGPMRSELVLAPR